MAERFQLDTPEAVPVTFEFAGIGTRFLAALLDLLIIVVLLVVVALGAVALSALGDTGQTVGAIVFVTVLFVVEWGYFMVFETLWNGQTPGKRKMEIRVLQMSGYPISVSQAAIRNIVLVVELNALGMLVMFISPQSRRLGDYAAGTMVVKEKQHVALADLGRSALWTPGGEPLGALGANDPDELNWNLRALTSADLTVSEAFLHRAPGLQAEVRQRIGDEIAMRIAARIGAREPLDPVRFINRVLYLYQQESM